MPTSATTTSTATFASSLFRRSLSSPALFFPPPPSITSPRPAVILSVCGPASRGRVSCQVALSANLSSLLQAATKIGKRVRVKVPVKVYHAPKAPELDLNGSAGVIKQYVGVWKDKRISSNLPFKVEFEINVDGQSRPVKFFAHLKEDEFEYLSSSD